MSVCYNECRSEDVSQHITTPKIRDTTINPLSTNDAVWHRQFFATSYQLAQSILKPIGSALVERVGQGEVGGCTALASCL